MKTMLLVFIIIMGFGLSALEQPLELLNDANDADRITTRINQLKSLTSNNTITKSLKNIDSSSLQVRTDRDTLELWIYNFLSNSSSLISVTRQIESSLCNIYVHDDIWNVTVDAVDVEYLRTAFEDSTATDPTKGVYELDTNMFGPTSDIDNNGKTNILIYNIDDTDINGYFSPSDLLGGAYSNNMELLYIDDNPHDAGINSSYCYATLAHEFQHLIHCNHDSNESLWVNEGLAGFAQWVNGWISPYWMMLFTQNPDNNIIHWNAGADYPQSYLFMHYLYEHYVLADENIIYNLVSATQNSMEGLDAALVETGWGTDVTSINVFNNWVIANHINNPIFMDGLYSYSDNPIGTGQFSLTNTSEHSSYPITSNTVSMNHWSVNYILLENADFNLSIDFDGNDTSSDFHVQFITFYNNEPVEVLEMDLNTEMNGNIILPNSRNPYDEVLMVVTDTYFSYSQVSYSYNISDAVGSIEDEVNLLANYSVSNYPNPFNPTTKIQFSLPEGSDVSLDIYDIKGQRVRSLTTGFYNKGNHSVSWYGNDEFGNDVSSNIYFYKLKVNGKVKAMKKCLLLK